jgi:hypothetical protein
MASIATPSAALKYPIASRKLRELIAGKVEESVARKGGM